MRLYKNEMENTNANELIVEDVEVKMEKIDEKKLKRLVFLSGILLICVVLAIIVFLILITGSVRAPKHIDVSLIPVI